MKYNIRINTLIISLILIVSYLGISTNAFSQSINYKLVWSDEFDGYGAIDTNKWFHQTKLPLPGSWYNGEIQHYTNRAENSARINGVLKITAKKENYFDQGYTKQFTSARLNSKFAFKYGKVEFRAKLPIGIGTWPAVWMLGKNIRETGAYFDNNGFGTTDWPACGEIDILEHWGSNQNFVQSALHTPSSFGNTQNKGGIIVKNASSEFHVYSMEWTSDKMIFSVDSIEYYTYQPSVKNINTWPFDAEQYLLLNIAIQNNIASNFNQSSLEIDYIRVYQDATSVNIENNELKQTLIYPNPFRNQFSIRTVNSNDTELQVVIHSIDQRLVYSEKCKIYNNEILIKNLDDLEKGIYIVTFTINNQLYNHKIIKH